MENKTYDELGLVEPHITEPSIEELKAKYGKLYAITVPIIEDDDEPPVELTFLFKRPTAMSYERFTTTAPTSTSKAARAMVLDTVIEEHRKRLVETLDVYPGAALSINDKLLAQLGMSKETTVKKL